jgi:uncharacterized protein YkwD
MPIICPRRPRVVAAALVAAGLVAAGAAGAPAAQAACSNTTIAVNSSNVATVENAVLCLVNQERANAGRAPLANDARLKNAAKAHSADMVSRKFFSHTNPDNKQPCDRILAAGYPTKCYWDGTKNLCWTGRCGENIAYAYPSVTAQQFMNQWMGSAGHKAAILNPAFKHIGVGIALATPFSSTGATATQTFGSPA